MRILVRLSLLVFIPIIVGIALLVTGHSIGGLILAFGVPAVMIVLVIVGLIMMMTGKLFDKPSDKPTKENEQAALEEINNSKYYSSQFKLSEYEANQILEGTKTASKKGLAIGILFFLMLVVLVALATAFTIKQIWIGAIVCAALFGGTIITILITVAIREKLDTNKNISKAKLLSCGTVKSCVMCSIATSKSVTPTVRVQGVIYRIVANANGVEYAFYSKQFHETDEKVVLAVMSKKHAKIIEEADLENYGEDIKSKYYECLQNGCDVINRQTNSSHSSAGRNIHSRRGRH